MTLKSDVKKLVKQVFNEAHGYDPSKIRDFGDNPPSEKNSYLFNAMMTQYEGKCTGKSSIDYLFFIYFNPEDKDWEYSFTPLPKN